MMNEVERQQARDLAARMTPERMLRILAVPTSESDKQHAAIVILACCAKAMMEGAPIDRTEAYDLHERITRWVWDRKCESDWKGFSTQEVL